MIYMSQLTHFECAKGEENKVTVRGKNCGGNKTTIAA